MKSPTASNWTSPKSNLRTPRRSNKGKTGNKRIGPATRTSTTIGKSDTIGFWNRRAAPVHGGFVITLRLASGTDRRNDTAKRSDQGRHGSGGGSPDLSPGVLPLSDW